MALLPGGSNIFLIGLTVPVFRVANKRGNRT